MSRSVEELSDGEVEVYHPPKRANPFPKSSKYALKRPRHSSNGRFSASNHRSNSFLDLSCESSFTHFALSGVLEKLVTEVQLLRGVIEENEKKAEDRHEQLLSENAQLAKSVKKLRERLFLLPNEVAPLTVNDGVDKHSNGSGCEKYSTLSKERSSNDQMEIRHLFVDNSPSTEQNEDDPQGHDDEEEESGEEELGLPEKCGRALVKMELFGGSPPKAVQCAEKETSSVAAAPVSKSPAKSSHEVETTSFAPCSSTPAPESREIGQTKEAASKSHANKEESEKTRKRIYMKPQPTDLPKPTVFRMGEGSQIRMSEEWKEYALTVFPVDPSHYWDIPREDYDLLIPDHELEKMTAKEKGAAIRSIYDWFRFQHRVAQLRVVLGECEEKMDLTQLRKVYEQKMIDRGWPIYGKKLKKCEVHLAQRQIMDSFFDPTDF